MPVPSQAGMGSPWDGRFLGAISIATEMMSDKLFVEMCVCRDVVVFFVCLFGFVETKTCWKKKKVDMLLGLGYFETESIVNYLD